jgi:hypothetical protein
MAGMTAPALDVFKGRHFDRDVIVLCVRWYLSSKVELAPSSPDDEAKAGLPWCIQRFCAGCNATCRILKNAGPRKVQKLSCSHS